MNNAFDSKKKITTSEGEASYWSLGALEKAGLGEVSTLPLTLRIGGLLIFGLMVESARNSKNSGLTLY